MNVKQYNVFLDLREMFILAKFCVYNSEYPHIIENMKNPKLMDTY